MQEIKIDALKNGLLTISEILNTIFGSDKNKDGKIDNVERVQLITRILPQAFPIFNLYPNLAEEVKDGINDAEFEELVKYTQSLDFLPSEKEEAEKYVKKVILWINYNRRFVKDSISFFDKKEVEVIKMIEILN